LVAYSSTKAGRMSISIRPGLFESLEGLWFYPSLSKYTLILRPTPLRFGERCSISQLLDLLVLL
jgi:hypothetical protein